jgi:hypothetical protein
LRLERRWHASAVPCRRTVLFAAAPAVGDETGTLRRVALEPEGDLELPAIVIGRRCDEADLRRVDEAPWLAAFTHQCGGYACMQEAVVGIVMPLAWNATGEAAGRVLHGLDALAADSPSAARAQRLPAELHGLHLTAGQPYHRGQLDALEDFVAQAFRLPRPIRGVEAFVELADCDSPSVFGEWRALSTDSGRDLLGDRRTGDWASDIARARGRWDGETVLDRGRLDALVRRLGWAGIDPSLQVFLLWDNSD